MARPPKLRWTFHGTAAVRSYDAARDWLEAVCGLRVLEYSDNRDPLVARRGGVTWIGDGGLELMEPTLPGGPPDRFLRRFGPGMYGLALQLDDLRAAAAHFASLGAECVGEVERGYLFTRPRHTAGLHLEWADKRFSDFDPRFGAPLPRRRAAPLVDVRRVAWWGALVADPRAAAERLRALCPLTLLLEDGAADPARPQVALSLEDGALVLFRLPEPDEAAALWGAVGARPRVHAMALRVPDLAAAAGALERERVRILRGDPRDGEIVTDPEDTQGLVLAWTDRDLPDDPRGPLEAAP